MPLEDHAPAHEGFQGYRPSAIVNYVSPRNVGRLEDANARGYASSADADEHVELSLKIDAHGNVTEARFRARGCPALVAAGSVATQIIVNNPLYVAVSLTPSDLDYALGRLPELRRYTTALVIAALHKAVLQHYERAQPARVRDPRPQPQLAL